MRPFFSYRLSELECAGFGTMLSTFSHTKVFGARLRPRLAAPPPADAK